MACATMARLAVSPAATTTASTAAGTGHSASSAPTRVAYSGIRSPRPVSMCISWAVSGVDRLSTSVTAQSSMNSTTSPAGPAGNGRRTPMRIPNALAEARGTDVTTTTRTEDEQQDPQNPLNGAVPKDGRTSLSNVTALVLGDMLLLQQSLMDLVGNRHPMLMKAAEQIFMAGGKRIRPALVFLAARGTMQLHALSPADPITLTWQHRRLAQVVEMIHTASLVHDDVLDESDQRRGAETVHRKFNTRLAVLAGDYLFAQSSWHLANLENLEVIKLISKVIADFADGEIAQASALFNTNLTMDDYLDKSFYKTASLIAASLKSAAIFSDVSPAVSEAMYIYGKHLGLAFQVVDDILDFTQDSATLGKPAGSDLASGNLTAPTLFALKKSERLRELVDSKFEAEGSLEEALRLVKEVGGIEEANKLARAEADTALRALECLPACDARRGLEAMVDYVLERLY